ncbi:MAG: hypothetical protein JSS93_01380 [Bacteroidetes bacterium]|nr:hypothetical protein [Bacteroidota bacterium]
MKPTQTPIFVAVSAAFLLSFGSSYAQCHNEFRAKSDGKEIKLEWANVAGKITLEVFTIHAQVEKVRELSVEGATNSYTFSSLASGTYVVKIEWGNKCSVNVGGLEGLIIKTAGHE